MRCSPLSGKAAPCWACPTGAFLPMRSRSGSTVPGRQLKWSVFWDFPVAKMYSTVREWAFPFIKNLHGDKSSAYAKYIGDAIFKIPTPLMLDKIVTALDGIYDRMAQLRDTDVRGTLRIPLVQVFHRWG